MDDVTGPGVWHYDGQSALRRSALLVDEGETFRLAEGARDTGPFLWRDLRANDVDTGQTSYGLNGVGGWRIGFVDTPEAALAAKLPKRQRYGRVVDRVGLWPASIAFAAVAALVVAIVLQTPAMVARLIPASAEKRMGDLMVGDFGKRGCDDPAGRAALAAMLKRLDPAAPDLDVHVVKLGMVNAVTLPGGRIVLFDGLLKSAASPDEVAGVIGHELGHVRHRDVTEALVRQLGLSVVLGGMEGNIGGYTNALLSTAYSRKAETNADTFAIALMRQAGVSPAPTAGFFRRLGRGGGRAERMLAYVNTHPVSSDRAKTFEASAAKGATYRPTLDQTQWAALKTICKGTPQESRWRF
ncbi:MAG TPA: M48 family metallopeptidase [Sphingomonas sp.]|jgi:Zn-dependent protease with chaperone function|nr:M48 family metallopeptidase [Sphingomonas sp.]